MTRLLASSRKIPMPSVSPAMAPRRERAGRRRGATTGFGSIAASSTTTGGRRDAEKIGRSWVAVNDERGIAHKAFPLAGEPCDVVSADGGLPVLSKAALSAGAERAAARLGSAGLRSVACWRLAGSCDAALTRVRAPASPAVARTAYRVVRRGLMVERATIQKPQARPASVRPRP